MSKQIVLSQHLFLAIEGVERALRLLGEGEYRFKDATFTAPWISGGMVGEAALTYIVRIKGRVYVKGQKPKKLEAEMKIRAYPKGGPAPCLDREANVLHFEGQEYYTSMWEGRISLHVWYTEENPINPGYNPPKLKLIAEEQE